MMYRKENVLFLLFGLVFYLATSTGSIFAEEEAEEPGEAVVAAGSDHTLTIKADGSLWSWGYNDDGQLGIGNQENQNTPMQVGTDADWRSLAAGGHHSLAIKSNGTLWAWGGNYYGPLGNGQSGGTSRELMPIQIGTEQNWKMVAAAGSHSFALKTNGTLWAWGYNGNGELGDGTKAHTSVPTQIGSDSDWLTISSAYNHTVALKRNGTLWAWGNNRDGQLGDGTKNESLFPKQIGMDSNWAIAVAGNGGDVAYTMALKADGSLWAWGSNNEGEFGNGTTDGSDVPVQIGSEKNWFRIAVSRGSGHTLAIKNDGSLWAWGRNDSGQLGDGTTIDKLSPEKIGSDSNWITVMAGTSHSLAVNSDGEMFVWGRNERVQLGNGTTPDKLEPARIGVATDWDGLALGRNQSMAVKSNNTLWNWGTVVGTGTVSTPTQLGSDTDWKSFTSAGSFSFGIKNDDSLWGWGSNTSGQLGDGTTDLSLLPKQIGGSTWKAISAGYSHTMGIQTNGTLWTWGANDRGQLGDGSNDSSPVPVQIGIDTGWATVSAGTYFSLALKSDGTLWAWGKNNEGQVGIGTWVDTNSPTEVTVAGIEWVAVAAGEKHALALGKDASDNVFLYTWGYNSQGQLGLGYTGVSRNSPFRVGASTGWKQIAANRFNSAAVKTTGTLWVWGDNHEGQIGDGTLEERNTPTKIGSATDWDQISLGEHHAAAFKTDGSLWAWGENYYGQLGDGTIWSTDPMETIAGIRIIYPAADCDFFILTERNGPTLVICY